MKANIIKEQIERYKRMLASSKERYSLFPFAVLKNYQQHWDIEALDFKTMFDQSFKSEVSNTLWSADQFRPKEIMMAFIDMDKEFVRLMFRQLYNEEKDISLRVEKFVYYCDEMLMQLMKKNRKESMHYHGDLRMITTYLALEFPAKYTMYSFNTFRGLLTLFEAQRIPVVDEIARYQTLMRSLYTNFMLKDQELVNTMTELCKEDTYFAAETTFWVNHFAQYIGVDN